MPGLAEHRFADAELADVVQERGLGEPDREVGIPAARERELLRQARDAFRVSFGAGIFRVELPCESAQAAEAAIVVGPSLPVVAVELGAVPEGGVAAGGLRVDEGDLRESEQLVGSADVLEVADARRGGDVPTPSIGAAASARRAARQRSSRSAPRSRQDPAEVVGGQTRDELAVANGRCEPAADLRQHAVAREAPVLGVDPLEAVDVDEDERERTLVALCAPRLGAQLLVEGAMVGKVRQLVAGREGASWALASANATAGCAASASSRVGRGRRLRR